MGTDEDKKIIVNTKDLLERARDGLKIALVYAGDKNEPDAVIERQINSRDWKSYRVVAENIAETLEAEGFSDVVVLPEDRHLGDVISRSNIDLVWLNSGGVQGINPMAHAPALLEMLGVPYIGHNPLAVSILDNKHVFKSMCMAASLPTARSVVIDPSSEGCNFIYSEHFESVFYGFPGPFVIKPVSGRASKNVYFVDSKREVKHAVEKVWNETNYLCLVEEYLPGREFAISIMGSRVRQDGEFVIHDGPFAFSAVQRVFEPHEKIFTSMDEKPITDDRIRLLDLSRESGLIREMEHLARQVFAWFTLSSLVRLDLRESGDGELHLLEANPKPDLKRPSEHSASITCRGLAQRKMSYADLIVSILAEHLTVLAKTGKKDSAILKKLMVTS